MTAFLFKKNILSTFSEPPFASLFLYYITALNHRHLRNIDCLMAHTTCLVCFINTVNGHSKKKVKKAKNVALVVST
jgi:hypothetical protein